MFVNSPHTPFFFFFLWLVHNRKEKGKKKKRKTEKQNTPKEGKKEENKSRVKRENNEAWLSLPCFFYGSSLSLSLLPVRMESCGAILACWQRITSFFCFGFFFFLILPFFQTRNFQLNTAPKSLKKKNEINACKETCCGINWLQLDLPDWRYRCGGELSFLVTIVFSFTRPITSKRASHPYNVVISESCQGGFCCLCCDCLPFLFDEVIYVFLCVRVCKLFLLSLSLSFLFSPTPFFFLFSFFFVIVLM